jgi:putative transposase
LDIEDRLYVDFGGKSGQNSLISVPSPGLTRRITILLHVVDGQGIPLGVTLSGANVHDKKRFRATLDLLIVARPLARNIEQHLCADKGYDFGDIRLSAKRRGYITHIPHRGVRAVKRGRGQQAHRWVIERTNRWHNLFRRLKIRYEVHARNYLAFVHMANAIICFRRARA